MPTGQILHLQAEITRQLLVDAGLIIIPPTTQRWAGYVSFRPDQPDDCVVFFDTAGVKDARNMITGEGIEYLGVEVLLRSNVYPDGRKKLSDIAYHLDTEVSYTDVPITDSTGTTTYKVITMNKQSGPFSLGKEEGTDRYLFSVNYLTAIENLQ